MATNMAPHNLVEVIGAARHLIANPTCSLDDLMKFVPGPDLPCGGRIVGLEGIRDAYLTGGGSFRTRATAASSRSPRGARASSSLSCPTSSAPRRSSRRSGTSSRARSCRASATSRTSPTASHGLRLIIEVKNGFNPEAVLEQLYKLTPMEENFGINNVALVDGQPRTMGLKELLKVYVDFRTDVVRRRCGFRLAKKEERLHLVEGLLIAIVDIDEVIQVIRRSDDAGVAKARLMDVFDLSGPGDLHPRPPAAAPDRGSRRSSSRTRRTTSSAPSRSCERCSTTRSCSCKLVSTELADVAKTHGTAPHGPPRGLGASATADQPLAARDRRRPVLGAPLVNRAARAHRQRRAGHRRGGSV